MPTIQPVNVNLVASLPQKAIETSVLQNLGNAQAADNTTLVPKSSPEQDTSMKAHSNLDAGIHVLTESATESRLNKAQDRALKAQMRETKEAESDEYTFDEADYNWEARKPRGLDSGQSEITGTQWAQAQNRRGEMQDVHGETAFSFASPNGQTHVRMTSVFDGNGDAGEVTAQKSYDKLPSMLGHNLEKFGQSGVSSQNIYNAFRQTLVDLNTPETYEDHTAAQKFLQQGGTTANIAADIEGVHYTANTGDSREILLIQQNDGKHVLIQTSEDQGTNEDVGTREKRFNKDGIEKHEGKNVGYFESRVLKENSRYTNYGYYISDIRKSNGLNIARYIGNHLTTIADNSKTALPKITAYNIKDLAEKHDAKNIWSLQCSDGIFKALTTEAAGNFVLNQLSGEKSTSAAESLVKLAAATGKTGDNSTALVTKLF